MTLTSSSPALPTDTPKVSVCMTAYNHENYITESLNSILTQEVHFPYEIVLGEDCSTDKTREIALDFQKQHPDKVRLILPGENLGLYGNRLGVQTLKACRGQYLALLNGDDYWTSPYKLQKQVNFLDKNPDFSVCFHNVRVFDDEGREEPWESNGPNQKRISTLEDLWQGNFIYTCSAMVRRDALGDLPDWFETAEYQDWAVFIVCSLHGKIGYIDEVMGVYRLHDGGVWAGTSRTEQLEKDLRFYMRTNLNLNFAYEQPIRRMIAGCCGELVREDEKHGRKFWKVHARDAWLYYHPVLYLALSPDSHFSFDSANHRVASDAFIYAGWKALKALRRSTPNG